jgi:cbb3-type cytochrome oxidase maturation protein
MSVLFLVLPLAIVFAALAVAAFIYAARAGQFDDLTTPALRILPESDSETDTEQSHD